MSDSEIPCESIPNRWIPVLLVGLPIWLVASAVAALWFYFHKQEVDALNRQSAFAREISIASLGDDLRKFISIIGERHTSDGEPAINLMRAASMIEGVLGPSNTGLDIRRIRGPESWPIIETTIPAKKPNAPSIWILTGYDATPGTPGCQFNSSGLAVTIACIQAAANDAPDKHLRFLFLPHMHDPDAPIAETLRAAAEIITNRGEASHILWIEAMSASRDLHLRANQPQLLPIPALSDLGFATSGRHGLEIHDDVPSWLLDSIIRVSTRAPFAHGGEDSAFPSTTTAADAAGKLLELIRRLGNVTNETMSMPPQSRFPTRPQPF